MSYSSSVHAKAIQLIRLAIEMTTAADSGHPTSGASLAHLVTVLMYDEVRYDPRHPDAPAADRLVLSEGHACPIIYAAGADLGLAIGRDPAKRRPMTREDALTLRQIQSPIDGHPNPAEGFSFFPAATGSLGQGLSVATGLALAARLDGIDKRVFCLLGDGESREGQIAEAIDFLVDHRLLSVCPIFNCNGFGQTAPVSPQQSPERIAAKLEAAGLRVEVIDGHDPVQVKQALTDHAENMAQPSARPFAIVARTVKGWGFTSALETSNWHGKPIEPDRVPKAMAALDKTAQEVHAAWTEGDLRIPPPPPSSVPSPVQAGRRLTLREALKEFGQEKALDKGRYATRKAFGIALRALGHVHPQTVVLDGDVGNSTYTEYFAKDPALKDRFFECRIAEQHMVSCAGGLASGGKTPFASTFGKFLTRAYDQVEMALISQFNLKLVGSHVGVTLAADGPSQMALPDVAWFHAWSLVQSRQGGPVMYLLNPSDAWSAYALTWLMAEHEGACYLRTMRPDTALLYDERMEFSLGGHQVVSRGQDLVIFATGYMVHEARRAMDHLAGHGIAPTLVDLYSLPFDGDAIADLVERADGRVLTLEDNYGGGFGSAVADALAQRGIPHTLHEMYVRKIPKSGLTPDDLLRYVGLSADHIVETVSNVLDRAAR